MATGQSEPNIGYNSFTPVECLSCGFLTVVVHTTVQLSIGSASVSGDRVSETIEECTSDLYTSADLCWLEAEVLAQWRTRKIRKERG